MSCRVCRVTVHLSLTTESVYTDAVPFSYLPPTIDLVLPSTMDADSEDVSVRGSNFGREQVRSR